MPGPPGNGGPGGRLTRAPVVNRCQGQVEEGLRILARLIARSYLRDQVRCRGNGAGNLGEIPTEVSDPINLNMEQ